VFPTAFATFWGAFGHLDPSHPEWFMGWYRRPELSPFAAALATPLEWVWPFRSYPPRSWVYPLLALATGASAAGWVRIYLRWKQAGATGAAAATRPAPRAESSPPARGGRKRRASQPATAPVRPLDPPVAGPDSAAAAGAGILALHWVFVAAAFLNFNATYFQAQGRYLFPALAATTLALVRGWGEWTGSRPTILVGGVGGGLLLLALYALFGVIGPGF